MNLVFRISIFSLRWSLTTHLSFALNLAYRTESLVWWVMVAVKENGCHELRRIIKNVLPLKLPLRSVHRPSGILRSGPLISRNPWGSVFYGLRSLVHLINVKLSIILKEFDGISRCLRGHNGDIDAMTHDSNWYRTILPRAFLTATAICSTTEFAATHVEILYGAQWRRPLTHNN